MSISLFSKNKKKQVAYSVVLTPGMVDSARDCFTEDAIMDGSHAWMCKGAPISDFHGDRIDPKDASIVENHITMNDYKVNLDTGEIEPMALVTTQEVETLVKSAKGNDVEETALLVSLIRERLNTFKLMKAKNKNIKIIRKGSNISATKFFNKDLWQDVLDGRFKAMSIKGFSTEHEEIDV